MDAKLVGKTKWGEMGTGKDAKSGSGASTGAFDKQDDAMTVVSKKSGNPENSPQMFSLAGDMSLQKVSKK